MKKIFLLIVVFIVFINHANAMEFRDATARISVDGEVYTVYYIDDRINYAFFLNLSHNYNLDFNSYYPISYEEAGISPQIAEFVRYKVVMKTYSDITEYGALMTRKLWQELYPSKEVTLYNPRAYEIESLNQMEDRFKSLMGPLDFTKEIYQIEEDEELIIDYKYLKYLSVVDDDGLEEVYITPYSNSNSSKLYLKGKAGSYRIILKIMPSGTGLPYLLTDGENILLVDGSSPDKTYELNVEIGFRNFKATITDEKGNPLVGKLFTLYRNDILYENVMTDSRGMISKRLPKGNYMLRSSKDNYQNNFVIDDDLELTSIVPSKSNQTVVETTVPSIKLPGIGNIIINVPEEEEKTSNNEDLQPIIKLPEKEVIQNESEDIIEMIFPDTLCL